MAAAALAGHGALSATARKAIVFDQVGTIGSVTSGTTVSCTDGAASGATVLAWVYWASTTNNGAATAQYGTTSMTLVGSTITAGNHSGFFHFLALFQVASPGGGGTVTATLPAAVGGAEINTISYLNVGSVGSPVGAGAISTALSDPSVVSAAGHLVTNVAVQFATTPTFSSYNQTQRFYTSSAGTWPVPMLLGDAAGASSVSFSLTSTSNTVWIMGAADLTPAATTSPTTMLPGHGALSATAKATQFKLAGALPGHGALAAVAHATKFVLAAALPGHGVLVGTIASSAVAYDATGTGYQGNPAGSAATFTHNATAGATVLLFITVDRAVTPSSITYGGTTMTLLGSVANDNNSAVGSCSLYKLSAVAGGSKTVSFTTGTAWVEACTVSYTHVSSLSGVRTVFGQATSLSNGPISCSAGQMIVNALGVGNDSGSPFSLTSLSGGVNRYNAAATDSSAMEISDTATSGTTFSCTASALANWCGLAVQLLPSYPAALPGHGALTGTAAATKFTLTAALSGVGALAAATGLNPVLPGHGALSATAYAAKFTLPVAVPGHGALTAKIMVLVSPHLTGHGALTATAILYGPMGPLLNKLSLGQSVNILVSGDSTAWGLQDAFQTTLFGWGGRMALALGEYFNANVQAYALQYPSMGTYGSVVSVYTSSGGGGAPMITLYDGSWPGGTFAANLLPDEATILAPAVPDVVIINEGFNETSTSAFTSGYLKFINNNSGNDIQTTYPGVPIVVTTQNATTITEESGHGVLFTALISALLTTFLPGTSLPLSPPLQYSTEVNGVWVLDTHQAFPTNATLLADVLFTDGLHPIAAGYLLQAEFMLSQMAPQVVSWQIIALPGHGALTATAMAKITAAPHGHGALSATAHATEFILAAGLHGHGALSATAHATKFILAAAVPGHGALTATATSTGAGTVGAQTGHGVLSVGAEAIEFIIACNPKGVGHLSVTGKPLFRPALPGHGALTCTGTATEFRLGDSGGGHGALSCTALADAFKFAFSFPGRGALSGRAVNLHPSAASAGSSIGAPWWASQHIGSYEAQHYPAGEIFIHVGDDEEGFTKPRSREPSVER